MPNQSNYSSEIPVPYIQFRPDRLSIGDRKLVGAGNKQILFGINVNDVVELWFYDSNGNIAGHLSLSPNSEMLALVTGVDNTGSYEFLTIDMGKVTRFLTLDAGRYGLVVNFFRNEVGSESGQKLYISRISRDRTELQLLPLQANSEIHNEILEWVVPSVPKQEAKGLIDQIFGQSHDALPEEILDGTKISTELNTHLSNTSSRLMYADVNEKYLTLVHEILKEAYGRSLEKMAADVHNLNIQQTDLDQYLHDSITEIIHELKDAGVIDQRLNVT
jgi:hypothetical protein